jgi:hypothetical protein
MEQSSVRKEGIRQMDKYQSIMEELAVARMLIRELGDRLAKLEKDKGAAVTLDEMRKRYDNHFAQALGIKKP